MVSKMSFSIQKNIRQAEKYLKLKEYKKAETLYLEIIVKFPKNHKALNALKILKSVNKNVSAGAYKNRKLQELNNYYIKKEFTVVIQKANELEKLYPKEINLYIIKGASNAALGKLSQAISCYEKILKIDPNSTVAYFNIAVIYDTLNSPEKSVENYKKAIENQSDNADAYNNMGSAYIKLGYIKEAADAYKNVIKIRPEHAYAYNNLGNVLMLQQSHNKAIRSFKQAIFFDENYADAYNNLGDAYLNINEIKNAHKSYEKALLIDPYHVKALHNVGFLHAENKEHEKAINAFQKALDIEPNDELAMAYKLFQQRQICKWEKLENNNLKISNLGINETKISPLILMPLEDSPERHLQRATNWVKNFHHSNHKPKIRCHKDNSKHIRVGYISTDFKNHPVAHLIAKVLETHSKDHFKVYGYSIGPIKNDAMRKRLIKAFDFFEDVSNMNDKDVANKVQNDEIDILIDLNGHTSDCRPGIFELRPSKIQINYLGYPGSMGAKYIDYIIADQNLIPKDYQRFYSEKPIYLPHHYQAQDDGLEIAAKIPTRLSLGLPEKGFIFCAINNTYKISSIEFDIWMRLLQKIDGSVLWLYESNKFVKDNLRKEASVRGIAPNRLIFAKRIPHDKYLAQLRQADLYLDTFNYNAGATASNALWAGLPVLTKQGKSYTARMASSLLKSLGMNELITTNELDYEKLALDLAQNTDKIAYIKQKLIKNRKSMPLFNTELFTRHLEDGYKRAYQKSLNGEKPDTIIVPE
jgi:protein O-GlcNAc transferase